MAVKMRETRELINKSEGATVSGGIFINRTVVQNEWTTARGWGSRHARKRIEDTTRVFMSNRS